VAGIAEFFLDRRGGCGLKEFPESRARVREAPGRHLDTEDVQGVEHTGRAL
jgi:hypothetical protein